MVNLKIIKSMEEEQKFIRMEKNMWAITKRIKEMDKVSCIMVMDKSSMKAHGKMWNNDNKKNWSMSSPN